MPLISYSLVDACLSAASEDLCAFLVDQGVATAYLHSGVKPMKRLELLQQLRSGEVDVIVGVNLLREVRSRHALYITCAMIVVGAFVAHTVVCVCVFCRPLPHNRMLIS